MIPKCVGQEELCNLAVANGTNQFATRLNELARVVGVAFESPGEVDRTCNGG